MKKNLPIILLLSLNLAVNAQWNQLPNTLSPFPPGPPGPSICMMGYTNPVSIMPVGKGKILYTSSCCQSPSSGGYLYLQYSNTDLSSMQIRGSYFPMGCPKSFNLSSANDTTFAFVTSGAFHSVVFTKNNFTPYASFGVSGNLSNYPKATAISSNYVYSFFQAPTNDSMRTLRTSLTNSITTKKANFTYDAIPDKLQFINDSTGFTIVTFKSNSSKTALLKTVDYGTNWLPVLVDSIDPVVDHHALSANRAYACKKSGAVYTSTNSGASWTLQGNAPSNAYSAIRFCDDTTGYIGGYNGVLYKSTDFGVNWTAEMSNTSLQIVRLFTFGKVAYFVDPNLGVHKNGPLNYVLFSPLNSYPVQTASISCITKYATSSYTVGSLYGPPYKFSIQSPSCTASYTTSVTVTNPTFTFNCPGVYSISATDGNNVPLGTQTLSVLMSYDYTTAISATKDTACIGSPVQLTFPTTGSNYTITSFAWSTGENYVPITVTPTATSTYSLSYGQMNNGSYSCNVWGSKTIIVTPCAAGIKEAEKTGYFRIYPNPATSSLYISSPPSEIKNLMIEISNAIGQVIIKSPFKSEIDIRQLPTGYYILKIYFGESLLHYNFIKE